MHLLGGVVAIKVEKPICIPSVVAACPEKADTRKTNFHTTTAFTNIDEHWQIDRASATGWSKETVDCNFIITHWFLEILYREVLVFWCFNGVRCVEFCLFKHFQYRAFTAPYKAWTLQNTLLVLNTHPNPINIHTLHPYAHNHLLQVSRDNSGQQQTPTDTTRRSQAHKKAVQGCVAVYVDIKGHLLVSDGVYWCFLLSYAVFRCEEGVQEVPKSVSECCIWTYLRFDRV